MHIISLDEKETVVVSDTVFEKIYKLATQNRICTLCEKPFDEETNPMIATNLCLPCFMSENSSLNLTPVPFTGADEKGTKVYRFLDSEGYVYIPSSMPASTEAEESISLTLAYWNLPDVVTVELDGKPVELDTADTTIYGDLKTNSVVVVSKRKKAGRLEVPFLSYKNGTCVYLDKAKGRTRKVWREAESQYLATKDARGRYHYKERVSRQPFQSDIYCLLSDNESAKYDKEQTHE